jgi:hypothetical protein
VHRDRCDVRRAQAQRDRRNDRNPHPRRVEPSRPTDLIALAFLIPLHRWLDGARLPTGRSLLTALLIPLSWTALVATTTATSCEQLYSITGFRLNANGSIEALEGYASIGPSAPGTTQVIGSVSDDGGLTWKSTSAGAREPAVPLSIESCGTSGRCYRVVDNRQVDVRADGADWSPSYRFTDDQLERINRRLNGGSPKCGTGFEGLFASVTVLQTNVGEVALVAMGEQGALVRINNGAWKRVAVPTESGEHQPVSVAGPLWLDWLSFAPLGLLIGAPFLALLRNRGGRRRQWNLGTVASAVASLGVFILSGMLRLIGIDYAVGGPVVLAVSAAAFAASIAIALRPAPTAVPHPQPPWPPPPVSR